MARGKDTSKNMGRVVDLESFRNRDTLSGKPGVTKNEDGSTYIDFSHPYWVNQANRPPDPPIHKVGDSVIDFRGEQRGVVHEVIESPVRGKSHRTVVRFEDGTLSHPYYESVWKPDRNPVPPTPIGKNKTKKKS